MGVETEAEAEVGGMTGIWSCDYLSWEGARGGVLGTPDFSRDAKDAHGALGVERRRGFAQFDGQGKRCSVHLVVRCFCYSSNTCTVADTALPITALHILEILRSSHLVEH